MPSRALSALVLATACVTPTSVPPASGLAGPMPLWTADGEGRPLGVPHVAVAVNGQPVDVMVDTGASQHFLLQAAAWAFDVPSEPFDARATDAHGVRFAVRLAAPGMLRVPGRPFHVPEHLFLLESHALWTTGVVGGVAPQLFAPAGWAAHLDFVGGRLDVTREHEHRWPGATRGRVCPAGAEPQDGWRYVVPVRVAGQEANLLLDTGAQSTTLYASSRLAPALRGGRVVHIAGAASVVPMRVIDGVPLEVGGAAFGGRVTVGPGEAHCGEDGLVGFDALRRCRISLSDREATLDCGPDEPPLHRSPSREAPPPTTLTRIDTLPACGRDAASLAPSTAQPLPHAYRSAIDAYVALSRDVAAHAERLESLCREEGFFDARVREPMLERAGDTVRVRFAIDEGRRFLVGRVTVSVVAEEETARLGEGELGWLRTRAGLPYRRDDVLADAQAIAAALERVGARVVETSFGRARHDGDARVDVHFALAVDGAIPPRALVTPDGAAG